MLAGCQEQERTTKKSNGTVAEGVHNRDVANVHNAIRGRGNLNGN